MLTNSCNFPALVVEIILVEIFISQRKAFSGVIIDNKYRQCKVSRIFF